MPLRNNERQRIDATSSDLIYPTVSRDNWFHIVGHEYLIVLCKRHNDF